MGMPLTPPNCMDYNRGPSRLDQKTYIDDEMPADQMVYNLAAKQRLERIHGFIKKGLAESDNEMARQGTLPKGFNPAVAAQDIYKAICARAQGARNRDAHIEVVKEFARDRSLIAEAVGHKCS